MLYESHSRVYKVKKSKSTMELGNSYPIGYLRIIHFVHMNVHLFLIIEQSNNKFGQNIHERVIAHGYLRITYSISPCSFACIFEHLFLTIKPPNNKFRQEYCIIPMRKCSAMDFNLNMRQLTINMKTPRKKKN